MNLTISKFIVYFKEIILMDLSIERIS